MGARVCVVLISMIANNRHHHSYRQTGLPRPLIDLLARDMARRRLARRYLGARGVSGD